MAESKSMRQVVKDWRARENQKHKDEREAYLNLREMYIPKGDDDCIPLPQNLDYIDKYKAKEMGLSYYYSHHSCNQNHKDVTIFKHARPRYMYGTDICRTCLEEKIKKNLPWRTAPHWRTEPCIIGDVDCGYRDPDQYKPKAGGRRVLPHEVDFISKETARRIRLLFYFPKRPCPRGHVDFRDTGTDKCASCEKEEEAIQKGKIFKPNLRIKGAPGSQAKASSVPLSLGYGNEELQKLRLRERTSPVIVRKQLAEILYFAKKARKELPQEIIDKLGYSSRDLRLRLDRMFHSGMSWSNWGKAWALDHIVSVKFLHDHDLMFPEIVNSIYNLQPLHPKLNSSKNVYVARNDVIELRERVLIPNGLDYKLGWEKDSRIIERPYWLQENLRQN